MALAAPVPIAAWHDRSRFDCGHSDLNEWLRERAHGNETGRASRCFVVCDGACVAGFYALAAGSVERAGARGSVRRNMPDPVPAVVLGRLGVDRAWQGRGLGADLLQDATLRSLRAGRAIGARVMLCHAVDEAARCFYTRHGFVDSTIDPLTLMLDLRKAGDLLDA